MDELQQRLRNKAMDWLAQREYSRHELAVRLERKFGRAFQQATAAAALKEGAVSESPAGTLPLEPVLDWLELQGFLSDARCARLFVASHINRGHGPLRIRQELVFRKGLAKELVEAEMAAQHCDWYQLAITTLRKRFSTPVDSLKEKARRLRFLQSRGFSADQCYRALDLTAEETS